MTEPEQLSVFLSKHVLVFCVQTVCLKMLCMGKNLKDKKANYQHHIPCCHLILNYLNVNSCIFKLTIYSVWSTHFSFYWIQVPVIYGAPRTLDLLQNPDIITFYSVVCHGSKSKSKTGDRLTIYHLILYYTKLEYGIFLLEKTS